MNNTRTWEDVVSNRRIPGNDVSIFGVCNILKGRVKSLEFDAEKLVIRIHCEWIAEPISFGWKYSKKFPDNVIEVPVELDRNPAFMSPDGKRIQLYSSKFGEVTFYLTPENNLDPKTQIPESFLEEKSQ